MTILEWPAGLVSMAVKGTLLLAIGWCGALSMRRAPAVARHLVWLTVIVGVLLIPVVGQLAPVRVPLLPNAGAPPTLASAEEPRAPAVEAGSQRSLPEMVRRVDASAPAAARHTMPLGSIAVGVWLAVAIALLAWLVAGMYSVHRLIRRGIPVRSDEWTRALIDASDRLALADAPRLVMSDQVEMAFAFDVFTPTVILPASAEEWSADRRRAVLLHELAHIRRRDLIGHIIANVACAVYWFNPFVWAAARRLRVESELASDDVVLESGVRPSDYALHLLELVTNLGGSAPTVALAMARPKEFEGRLVAILDRAQRRTPLGRRQAGTLIGMLGLLTVSIAAVVPVPRTIAVAAAPTTTTKAEQIDSSPATMTPPRPLASTVTAKPPASRTPRLAPLSNAAIATLLRFGPSAIINPMPAMLRNASAIGLTGAQADSIATLNRRYMVRLYELWTPVSNYYLGHAPGSDEDSLTDAFRAAPRQSMELLSAIVPELAGLLTDEQRQRLAPDVARYLDRRYLSDVAAGGTDAAAGVFLPNGGLTTGPGQRSGGGGRAPDSVLNGRRGR